MSLMPDPFYPPHIHWVSGPGESWRQGETIPLPHTQEGSDQNHKDQQQCHYQSYDDTGEQFGLIGLLDLLGALGEREGEKTAGFTPLPYL